MEMLCDEPTSASGGGDNALRGGDHVGSGAGWAHFFKPLVYF